VTNPGVFLVIKVRTIAGYYDPKNKPDKGRFKIWAMLPLGKVHTQIMFRLVYKMFSCFYYVLDFQAETPFRLRLIDKAAIKT
jgi:hypothetical protein